MALKATIAKLEDVAEHFRAEYKPNADGTFRLDTEGVEDVSGLKSAATKERESAEAAKLALKDFMAKFKDIDPDEARKMMRLMATNAEMKLIAEGKIDEVIERRITALKTDLDAKVTAAETAVTAERDANKGLKRKLVGSALREAALAAGVHNYALDDVLAHGEPQWSLNDKLELVMMRNEVPVMAKDGKTPLQPKEWVESLKEQRPHYFPAPAGGAGGSQGGGGGAAGKNQLKRSAFEALGAGEKATFARGGGTVVD